MSFPGRFRVRHKGGFVAKGNFYLAANGVLHEMDRDGFSSENGYIVEFSTGLFDSTKWEDATLEQRKGWTEETWRGVEIFEGDIIDHRGEKGIVEWSNDNYGGHLGWEALCPDGTSSLEYYYGFSTSDWERCRVIGNIHEHKELLEAK
jgi:uncharacterized phage protein (TIGR01671 family)